MEPPKTSELPTAAYEVWCMEDGEEKMALERDLPEKATVNNELVWRSDVTSFIRSKLLEVSEEVDSKDERVGASKLAQKLFPEEKSNKKTSEEEERDS